MEADPYLLFLIQAVLLLFLLLFSGTQTALLTLSESELKDVEKKATAAARRVMKLLDDPRSLQLALKLAVLGTNVGIMLGSLAITDYLSRAYTGSTWYFNLLALFLTLFVLFLINVIWADIIVIRFREKLSLFASLPIQLYYSIVRPFARLAAKLSVYFADRFDVSRRGAFLDQQRLIAIVDTSEEFVDLKASERKMIYSIFEFGETEVREIMVPRIDMICVDENTSLEDVTLLIKEKGHSRIPLFKEGIDHITGILYAKDLLPYMVGNGQEAINLASLARPASFVPESKKLHQLLREFQQEKYHMAVVVDEYGGTAGLVTFEDIIEEIVGDIQDEYDEEPPLYRRIDKDTFMVDAKIDLHELNDALEMDLPTEGEYESLGGFIFKLTGYVPQEKEVVRFEDYLFEVSKIDRNRIKKIKLKREAHVEPAGHGELEDERP